MERPGDEGQNAIRDSHLMIQLNPIRTDEQSEKQL
jgi:hypothetical protein